MGKVRRAVLFSFVLTAIANPAQLILPGTALERDAPVTVIYQTGLQATGKGELRVRWTDILGRTVEDRSIPVELKDEKEVRFSLDLRRAVAMQNELHVHFSFAGTNKKGQEDRREEDAGASFVARPADRGWWDYMIMMWQEGTAEHFSRLAELGVNAGKSSEHSDSLPEFLLRNDLRWYVENMATDFYSAYHIYRPDRPYNYALLAAKELYRRDPASKEGLKRHPSFSDPAWLEKIQKRLADSARVFSPYRPIFYNLADESGIAELAGFWDFDFSDYSLDGMRGWLKGRYGSLAELNRQWGSDFQSWELVIPETTREAMKRADQNYSSWADFKEWMDLSFARALKVGADAVHSVDPEAYVGIEGAQMPGWGGYDYARLSATLDAMEPYDIGDNIEIVRSLNPRLAFVTTAFATGPQERHRVWYELLHGARGHIIWDEKHDVIEPDGSIGPRGRDVAPHWKELRAGVGALLINSRRQADPIAIHYSQASMRTDWMLAQRSKGDAWMERMSWTERKDSDFLRLRDSYCRLIEDHGLQYKFVSYGQVEQGELMKGGYRILILPRSSALSEAEANGISDFVRQGGTLVVDGEAGTFDEHSRHLPRSQLSALLEGDKGKGSVLHMDALRYRDDRVLGTGAQTYQSMSKVIAGSGVHPEFRVTDAHGGALAGVETHVFRNGGVTILGILSNPPMEVDDLGPLKAQAAERFERPRPIRLNLPTELYAYDVRQAKALGRVTHLALTLDGYEPATLAFSPAPIGKFHLSAPERIRRGETGRAGLRPEGPWLAQSDVFHVEVSGPDGKLMAHYSGNVLATGGTAEIPLPLALNDAAGTWKISAKELLAGQAMQAEVTVY